jgi:hypothetical protein
LEALIVISCHAFPAADNGSEIELVRNECFVSNMLVLAVYFWRQEHRRKEHSSNHMMFFLDPCLLHPEKLLESDLLEVREEERERERMRYKNQEFLPLPLLFFPRRHKQHSLLEMSSFLCIGLE